METLIKIFSLLTNESISDDVALQQLAVLKPIAIQLFAQIDEDDSLEHVIDGTVVTWISLLPFKYNKKPLFVFDTDITDFTTYLRRLKLAFEQDIIPFDDMAAYDGFLFDYLGRSSECELMKKIGFIFFDMFQKIAFVD